MFKYFFCKSTIHLIIFYFGVFCSNQAQAFFESQAKYDFEHRWFIMLNDNSQINIFKAMRVFLVYPEWGLPVLRKSMKNSGIEKISWQIGALVGMLGDVSDVKNLFKEGGSKKIFPPKDAYRVT